MKSPVFDFKNSNLGIHDTILHFSIISAAQALEDAKNEFLINVTEDGKVYEGCLPSYIKGNITSFSNGTTDFIKFVSTYKDKIITNSTITKTQGKFETYYRSVFGVKDELLFLDYDEGSLANKMFVLALKLWANARIMTEYATSKKGCDLQVIGNLVTSSKVIYRYLIKELDTDVMIKHNGIYVALKNVLK